MPQTALQDDKHTDPKPEPRPDSLYMMHRVEPHTSKNYAWDCPAERQKEILLNINSKGRKVDIMEIGALPPFKFPVCYFFAASEMMPTSIIVRKWLSDRFAGYSCRGAIASSEHIQLS